MKKNGIEQLYKLTKSVLSWLQIGCFLYAFACVLYWFLSLTSLEFIYDYEFLFEPVFAYISNFYNPETFGSKSLDIIGIIACLVFIGLAIIIHFLRDFVDSQEELYHINFIKQKKMKDLMVQRQIEKEYIAEMKKYNRFIILVDFKIQPVKSYLFDDNINEDNLKGLKTKILSEVFERLNPQYISNKSRHKEETFFVIGNIENTHQCLQNITEIIQELSHKHSNLNISLSYDLSFDAMTMNDNLKEKLEFLEKIMQLNYNNYSLTTSLFKTCFELISKSKLKFSALGTFQFLIANKSQNYELYSVNFIN